MGGVKGIYSQMDVLNYLTYQLTKYGWRKRNIFSNGRFKLFD